MFPETLNPHFPDISFIRLDRDYGIDDLTSRTANLYEEKTVERRSHWRFFGKFLYSLEQLVSAKPVIPYLKFHRVKSEGN